MNATSAKPLREHLLELRRRQRRLGTSQETADDFEAVLRLAHTINNALTAIYLTEAAAGGGDQSRRFFRETVRRAVA